MGDIYIIIKSAWVLVLIIGGITYDQIANENLQDLRPQASPPGKQLLQHVDQEMTQRRTDEGTVDGHLRHAGVDIVAVFASVFGDVRG